MKKRTILLNTILFLLIIFNEASSQVMQIDTTFGQNGIVTTSINVNGWGYLKSSALQNDGKIVATGSTGSGAGSSFALARYNPDGNLDNTFGTGGIVISEIGTDASANSVAIQNDGKIVVGGISIDGNINSISIQPDGKIIAAGYSDYFGTNDFALARYNTNGEPDDEFGINGVGILPSPGDEKAYSVAIQDDGKIVAAGYTDSYGTKDFVLVRCDDQGNLDGDFGTAGIVVTELSTDEEVRKVVVQGNGKIIAAGNSYDETSGESVIILARYETNGDPDSDFGPGGIGIDGIVFTEIGSIAEATSAVIQNDGKIIAAGFSNNSGTYDFTLVRYDKNGVLDSDFGAAGIVITPGLHTEEIISSVLIQSNGRIIAAGNSYDGMSRFTLFGYNPEGEEDNLFGDDGRIVTRLGVAEDKIRSLAIQEDNKIIALGSTFNGSNYDFALIRYNQDGTCDNSFNGDGIATTDIGELKDYAYSAAIQEDGKIIAAGYTDNGSNNDFALARYNPDGTLDSSFETNGLVITDIGTLNDHAKSVAIQEDGKIIAAGYTYNGSDWDFALVRYNQDGTRDNSFSGDGIVTTDIGELNDYAYSVAIQEDGKIIAGGFTDNGSNNDFVLVRYNKDGTIDDSFGTYGIVITDIGNDGAISIKIQDNGKIIAAGESDFILTLIRYNDDGPLDSLFGSGGKVITPEVYNEGINSSVDVQSNGKIIAAGTTYNRGDRDFALVRYLTNGELDTTFGINGISTTSIGAANTHNLAYSSVVQNDGKIVVAGCSEMSYGNFCVFTLARYIGDPVTAVKEEKLAEMPSSFTLEQNYPNPFNPTTTLSFIIGRQSFVSLKVYDVLGREVATLVNEEKQPGTYIVQFDTRQTTNNKPLSSGVYFYRIKCEDFLQTKKMILLH
ncbi:MAG: T9SS type A sorting domain-containing protein [Ignavibacteriaceae bacterium]